MGIGRAQPFLVLGLTTGTRARALEGLGSSGRCQQGEGARVKNVTAQRLLSIHLLVLGLFFLSIYLVSWRGLGKR